VHLVPQAGPARGDKREAAGEADADQADAPDGASVRSAAIHSAGVLNDIGRPRRDVKHAQVRAAGMTVVPVVARRRAKRVEARLVHAAGVMPGMTMTDGRRDSSGA
jgi:hypothetical protein